MSRTMGMLAGAVALALAGAAQAAPLLFDDFSYADAAATQAVWSGGTGNVGSGYTPGFRWSTGWTTVGTIPSVTLSSQAGVFNNTYGYRDLPSAISGDFTMNVQWVHTTYQRNGKVVFLDSTGQKGYGLQWVSASTNQYLGGGFFGIYKFDRTTPLAAYGDMTATTRLGADMSNHNGVTPYHPATGLDVTLDFGALTGTVGAVQDPVLADVELSWVKATGTFTLTVDGNVLGTRTDTTFTSFDRVYLTGNTSSLFDNLTITVPEPTMLAPLAVAAGLALARRRA